MNQLGVVEQWLDDECSMIKSRDLDAVFAEIEEQELNNNLNRELNLI